MAPATAASIRPVVDLDENWLFCRSCESLSQRLPVSECTQMQSHLKPKLPDMLYRSRFPGRIIIKGYLGGLVCAVAHISTKTVVYICVCVSARMHFLARVKSYALDTGIMQPIGVSDERKHKTTRRHEFCRVQTRSRSRTKTVERRSEEHTSELQSHSFI